MIDVEEVRGDEVASPSDGYPWRPGLSPLLPPFALALGLGLLASLVTGLSVATGMVATVGVCVIVLAVRRPPLALALLIVVEVSNSSTVIGAHGGLSLYLVALAVALMSLVLAVRRGAPIAWTPIYLLAGVVLVAVAVSILASPNSSISFTPFVELLKDFAFLFTVVSLLKVTGRYASTFRLMVCVVAGLALLTVVQQYLLHNSTTFHGFSSLPLGADVGAATPRHSGPEADVNFWGRTIVLFVPLALSLVAMRSERRRWWIWALAAGALAAGEYLTQSRGGILAFVMAVIVWVGVRSLHQPRVLLLVPALILGAALTPGVASRLGTLTQLTNPTATTADPSLTGRIAAQQLALAMFEDHPATGVGYGNFELAEQQYLHRPGIVDANKDIAPHDLYAQLAAEQGLFGLTAWLLLLGGAMVLALRVLLVSSRIGRPDWNLMAIGCLAALMGWCIASVSLHLADFRHFLAVVAVIAALDLACREAASGSPEGTLARPQSPDPDWKLRSRRLAAVLGVMALALGVAILAVVALLSNLTLRGTEVVASASAQVRPRVGAASNSDAYAWDTVNRQMLLLTFAAIARNPRFTQDAARQLALPTAALRLVKVHASGDPGNSVLTVSASGHDPQLVVPLAAATLSQARAYLTSVVSLYEVAPVAAGSDRIVHPLRTRLVVVIALLVVMMAMVAALLGARAMRPTGRHVVTVH
jgi:O-antigen ligase